MPHPYLLLVSSHPQSISPELWTQWYLEEHLRDMVHFGVARTAAFYRASSPVHTYLKPPDDGFDERSFLAMFQTDRKNALAFPAFKEKVRQTSKLFDEKLEVRGRDVAVLRDEEGVLVEVLGSFESNEHVAPHIIHTQLFGNEVEGTLQFEHVNAASKLLGYRRTLLYRPQQPKPEEPQSVTLIHEFESFDPTHLPSVKEEMEAIEPSKDCAFRLRSFELLDSEGYGGKCRMPARL